MKEYMLFQTALHSPSLRMGTMRGFICARYTIAHLTKQKDTRSMIIIKIKEKHTHKCYLLNLGQNEMN